MHLNRREFIGAGAATLLPWQDDRFVVHEWGVLTVADGATWALARGPGEEVPAFCARYGPMFDERIEQSKNRAVRKPVLHFYSKRRRTVSVRVRVPTGRPEVWWPPTADFGPAPDLPSGRGGFRPPEDAPTRLKPVNGHLHWKHLVIDPDAAGFADADGWWAIARKIPSTPVRSGDAADRFLFYEALLPYDPKLKIEWVDGIPRAEGAFGLRVRDGKPSGLEPAALVDALAVAGLTADEARRIVELWTPEWFATDGARVLQIVPRLVYDELLPLEITPKPDELARVLIVHIECLTPEGRAEIDGWIADLGAESADVRDAAMKKLEARCASAEHPMREALTKGPDPEVTARLKSLLSRLEPR